MLRSTVALAASSVVLVACAAHGPPYTVWSTGDVARGHVDIGCQPSTCDAHNELVPNCPVAPCYTCQFSSGTKMVVEQCENGWVVSGSLSGVPSCGVFARTTSV